VDIARLEQGREKKCACRECRDLIDAIRCSQGDRFAGSPDRGIDGQYHVWFELKRRFVALRIHDWPSQVLRGGDLLAC